MCFPGVPLKQQLRILERKLGHQPPISRWEKCLLAVIAVKLLYQTGKARQHLFKPETVLKWHQALVRRKWTFQQPRRVGRPAIDTDLRALVIRLAQESDWGYGKIKGELQKLRIRWINPWLVTRMALLRDALVKGCIAKETTGTL
jgi:putative transposase